MNILKRIVSFWTSVLAKNHIYTLAYIYNGDVAMVQENGVWRVVLAVSYVRQPQYLGKDNCFYPKSICEGEITCFATKGEAIAQVNKHFKSVKEWFRHTLSDTKKSRIYAATY